MLDINCALHLLSYLVLAKQRTRGAPPSSDSVLFDDTSSTAPMNSQGYYTPGYNVGGPPPADIHGGSGVNNLFADPMANAAVMYGSSLANQGKDIVNKEVGQVQQAFFDLIRSV